MAEAVAVLSMANAGFKLAITLFSFAEAIGSIDKEILRTAKDISLFSDVLQNLVDTLERSQAAKYITKSAFETIQRVIDEGRELFQELETMIEKSTKSEEVIKMKQDEMVPFSRPKLSVPLIKRLLYFFQRSRLETLRSRLESLKSTLGLMLGTLAIAEKLETKKSNPNMRPDSETTKAIRVQDELKMKCLVLANETAAAEVRKHTKMKVKNAKEKNKNTDIASEPRPSIASEGVFGELPKQQSSTNSEAPVPKACDKTSSNEHCLAPASSLTYSPAVGPLSSLMYSPAGVAKKDPEASNISVQETSQVVLALLALWVSNGAQLAEKNDQSKTAAGTEEKWKYEEKARADEEEELVDLFPKRESRPY